MLAVLSADLARITTPTIGAAVRVYFFPRGECFPYVVWLRILQAVRRHGWSRFFLGLPVYWIYRHFEFKYGVHANPNIEIGGGFRPVHGPCNLNAAIIGRNFTVYSGVTIGICRGGIPAIGNDVSIFPNAVVCGAIHIGDGATIGALTYVAHDVAPYTTMHVRRREVVV